MIIPPPPEDTLTKGWLTFLNILIEQMDDCLSFGAKHSKYSSAICTHTCTHMYTHVE